MSSVLTKFHNSNKHLLLKKQPHGAAIMQEFHFKHGEASASSTITSPKETPTNLSEIFQKSIVDQYRAIKVEIGSQVNISSTDEFETILGQALQAWQNKSSKSIDFNSRVRSVHLKIDAKFSELIPICLKKFGFTFHHCKPEYIYLHKWLASEEKNTYPPYCQHYVGVGGCVVDFEKEEILIITEKINLLPSHMKPYKFPGGQLDHHEFIEEGVCREVREETNVETNFKGILGFRYKKAFRFDNPDIYYICLLEPKSQEHKKAISACPTEIDLCQWVPLDVYFKYESLAPVQEHARKLLKRCLEMRKQNPEECDKLLFKSTFQSKDHALSIDKFKEVEPNPEFLLYPNV
ncbi:hypothetical protein C9374_011936 [Naegleria lovaniensis]|uniref:Nudix hydrolase domain-containing protein n=1 Tax=Naegleria lovaniensis TaxID=51637 RepID=A0AA88GDM7_NAELO|nr:uncharacterized protein C9374_011936 [Naegleria lovaniensis]KAG2373647.1 hypothetical protein C9374_011936 [Naegleria lovaniensis]